MEVREGDVGSGHGGDKFHGDVDGEAEGGR